MTDYAYDIYGRLEYTYLPDDAYTRSYFDGNGRVTRQDRVGENQSCQEGENQRWENQRCQEEI